MRLRLFAVYWKLRGVLAPELTHAQDLYEEVLARHVFPETIWLDLGCGHQLLPFWRADEERKLAARCATLVGLDCDLPSLQKHRTILLRVGGYASALPFPDNHFDLITANMVVEHLTDRDVLDRADSRVGVADSDQLWVSTKDLTD